MNYIAVDGGVSGREPSYGADLEAAMDIEDVIGLAPQATIDVYQAPSRPTKTCRRLLGHRQPEPSPTRSSRPRGGSASSTRTATLRTEESISLPTSRRRGPDLHRRRRRHRRRRLLRRPGHDEREGRRGRRSRQPAGRRRGGRHLDKRRFRDSLEQDGGGGVSSNWCMPSYQDQPQITGLISSVSVLAPPAACLPGRQLPAPGPRRQRGRRPGDGICRVLARLVAGRPRRDERRRPALGGRRRLDRRLPLLLL